MSNEALIKNLEDLKEMFSKMLTESIESNLYKGITEQYLDWVVSLQKAIQIIRKKEVSDNE